MKFAKLSVILQLVLKFKTKLSENALKVLCRFNIFIELIFLLAIDIELCNVTEILLFNDTHFKSKPVKVRSFSNRCFFKYQTQRQNTGCSFY